MARCFHFHFALKTEQERERGGDWRARGRRPAAVCLRSARAEGEKWGGVDFSSLPDSTGVITYALALHDYDLYCVSSPIGVLLDISEARLEVVVNIAALGARVQK
jgi:glutamate-5-semialdehyde dehydrogenase